MGFLPRLESLQRETAIGILIVSAARISWQDAYRILPGREDTFPTSLTTLASASILSKLFAAVSQSNRRGVSGPAPARRLPKDASSARCRIASASASGDLGGTTREFSPSNA